MKSKIKNYYKCYHIPAAGDSLVTTPHLSFHWNINKKVNVVFKYPIWACTYLKNINKYTSITVIHFVLDNTETHIYSKKQRNTTIVKYSIKF